MRRTRLLLVTALLAGSLATTTHLAGAHATTLQASPAANARAATVNTIAANVTDPETGQQILLTVTAPKSKQVTEVVLLSRRNKRKSKAKVVNVEATEAAPGVYEFEFPSAGFGQRIYFAEITRKTRRGLFTAPTGNTVLLTHYGWVNTFYFDETDDHIWTYDGEFDAKGSTHEGWHTVGAVSENKPYFSEFNASRCRAFRGAPVLMDDSEPGAQSTFTWGLVGQEPLHTQTVTLSSPVTTTRVDFTDGHSFRITATNDFGVVDGSDGPDAGPAIAGSAFLCDVNDTASIGGVL